LISGDGISRRGLGLETRLETHFCESWSRRFQVSSRYRRLQVSVTSLLSWDYENCKGMA